MSGFGEHLIMRDLARRREFQEQFLLERDINRLRLRHLDNPYGILGAAFGLAGAAATHRTTTLSLGRCVELVLWYDAHEFEFQRLLRPLLTPSP